MKIKKAEYIDRYRINLHFNDGSQKIIDFYPFLKKANNPMTYQFLDVEKFKKFRIYYGDLIWPRHEMAFSAQSLFEWTSVKAKVPV